ncbi:PAS domain S-box protein [Parvibaculum sedimenti]|uniref:PAS domain S-box protein n=1 Tax=Parvibaculum sedimenti TaxID=2608632 RepID=A0A6N6VG52_9HYPH|nr:PAS domain S-box protein [Parvibaculum sedimenti]KAB7738877.1 PAS domain S-box protein [Parvibaculum sedimenti]
MPSTKVHPEKSEARLWNALASFWRPIAFFGLFSLAILATDYFIAQNELDALKRYASEDLSVVARLNSEAITHWVESRISDAEVLARQISLTRDIEVWLSDGSPADDRAERIRLRMATMGVYRNYGEIFLSNTTGIALLSADGGAPTIDPFIRQLESAALQTRTPQISNIRLVPEHPDSTEIIICAPVMSQRDARKAIAVVFFIIDPQLDLFSLIDRWPGKSLTAETNIVMRVGDAVQFLTTPRHATAPSSLRRPRLLQLPLASDTPAGAAARGFRGTMEGVDYRGASVLATITDVPKTPWLLETKVDADELYAPFRRLRMIGLGGAVLLILIAGVSLLEILRREQADLIVRQLRAELREREISQRFDHLSKNTDEIILLVDDAGRVKEANERALSAYGYAADELIGRSAQDLHTAGTSPDYLNPDRMRTDRDGSPSVFESVQRRKDGSVFPVEIKARWTKTGGKRWLQLIIRDITERRERIDALTQLAMIVDSSGGAIVGEDLSGNIKTWNPAAEKLFGYSASEIVGRSANILLPPDRPNEIAQLIEKVRAGHEVNGYETVRRRKDGTLVNVSLIYSPIYNSEGILAGISAIVIDITERVKARRIAEHTSRALLTLSRANEALIRAASEQELFQNMCRVITEAGGYRMAWIGTPRNDPEKLLLPVASSGTDEDYLKSAKVTWSDTERGQGPTGTAFRTGTTQINQNFANNPRVALWRDAALQRGYGSSIALPLKVADGRVYGTLTIYANETDAFGADEVGLLEELANDLAFGVETIEDRLAREEYTANMAEAMEGTIAAVANTVEMRDLYTAGHQRRVTEIAEAIARKMGLPADRIRGLHFAGLVHDLGKINVPAEILSKPARLTDVEYELIKTHPQTGYDILKHVKFPWPIAQIILQHHERMDGSGYPNGLKGDEILLEARIIAVADVIDAMTSHRPYRPALGLEAALAEIKQGSGTIYDPSVVKACVEVIESGDAKFTASESEPERTSR